MEPHERQAQAEDDRRRSLSEADVIHEARQEFELYLSNEGVSPDDEEVIINTYMEIARRYSDNYDASPPELTLRQILREMFDEWLEEYSAEDE